MGTNITAKERKRSDITNKKISESLKEKNEKSKVKITVKREILKYDINGNFICSYNSLTDASKLNNVSKSALSSACNGKTRTSNGFIWKFKL